VPARTAEREGRATWRVPLGTGIGTAAVNETWIGLYLAARDKGDLFRAHRVESKSTPRDTEGLKKDANSRSFHEHELALTKSRWD
jgi:hypothetical protein